MSGSFIAKGQRVKFLALSTKNSELITWDNEGDLTVHWDKLKLSDEVTLQSLIIALGRYFPKKPEKEIINLAEALLQIYESEQSGFTIIVDADEVGQIHRTGLLSYSDSKEAEKIKRHVIWGDTPESEPKVNLPDQVINNPVGFLNTKDVMDMGMDVFGLKVKGGGAQNISSPEVGKVEFFDYEDEDIDLENDRSLPDYVPKSLFEKEEGSSYAAASGGIYAPKSPELYTEEAPIDIEVIDTSVKDASGTVTLFYGTNRNHQRKKELNQRYGSNLSNQKLGWCKVNIPKGHRYGEIERPWNLLLIKGSEKTDKHVMITSIRQQGKREFYKEFISRLNDAPERKALIYIHGYNNSFAMAARRAAQIAFDLPFGGITGFYSWPSAKKARFYGSDVEKADSSIESFKQFVSELIRKSGVEEIHFIAHSMGNRILTASLTDFVKQQEYSDIAQMIKHVVFAAPDVDQSVFKNTLLPYVKKVGLERTLYASKYDKPLYGASTIRNNMKRLGYGGKHIFVEEGLVTVDTSDINPKGFFDHDYVFTERPFISDLGHLINNSLKPKQRGLREEHKSTKAYWRFP
jgi:esterase/lipase superfamily enzyme